MINMKNCHSAAMNEFAGTATIKQPKHAFKGAKASENTTANN